MTDLKVFSMVNAPFFAPDSDLFLFLSKSFRVNVYTVDEVWVYNYLMCMGVDSFTTNHPERFFQAHHVYCFPYRFSYISYYILVGLLTTFFVFFLFMGYDF